MATLLSMGAAILFVVSLFFPGHPLLVFLPSLIGFVIAAGPAMAGGKRAIPTDAKNTIAFTVAVAAVMAPLFVYYGGVDKREKAEQVTE